MKIWQKLWIYFALLWSSLHLLRDISQDFGWKNFLSTPFVKISKPLLPWFWYLFNTYFFALIVLGLCLYAIRIRRFHPTGTLSLLLSVIIFVSWLFYWNFL